MCVFNHWVGWGVSTPEHCVAQVSTVELQAQRTKYSATGLQVTLENVVLE